MTEYSIAGAEPEWEAFVVSLDPAELERERFGTPGRDERPGSAADRRMRAAHEVDVLRFKTRRARVIADRQVTRLAVVEARTWDQRFGKYLTPAQLRVAVAALDRIRERETA